MDHICRIPGPLYIILIDHGGTDKFYLTGSNDWLEASKLNNWINTLEEGIQNCTDASKQDIIIIIDTCNAGSFMNDLIKPQSTRIVITSTAENEPSFRGPKSPSTDLLVRDGAFFASNLFNELSKGVNLAQSFEIAVQRTEILSFSDTIKPKYPFVDHAEQHPLLNDNGVSSGHNELHSSGNGSRAKGIKLGYGQNATEGPGIIEINIQPDRPLHVNESQFDISLRIKNPDDDLKVFFEIRAPDSQRPETINEQLQKELNLQQILLNKTSEGFYQKRCNEFQVAGKYTLFFYVQDADGTLYYANQSYVYKVKENNSPPAHFQLMYPMNLDDPENQGSTEKVSSPVFFQWEDTADRDPFTYSLWISKSRQFDTDLLIKVEDWIDSQYQMEFSESWDGCDVYWKVEAIDEFGASTETEIYRFKLNDINDPDDMSMVYFQVYDSHTQFPVPGAQIWFEKSNSNRPMITSKRGILIQQLDLSNTVDITISAPTYESAYTQITDKGLPILSLAIPLVSNVQTGDINRDENIDMGDAILALQILSGVQNSDYHYAQEALVDNNVGLADIIYVLRSISGLID
jgi:hypothetical protein